MVSLNFVMKISNKTLNKIMVSDSCVVYKEDGRRLTLYFVNLMIAIGNEKEIWKLLRILQTLNKI